jgi:hypothetical protein
LLERLTKQAEVKLHPDQLASYASKASHRKRRASEMNLRHIDPRSTEWMETIEAMADRGSELEATGDSGMEASGSDETGLQARRASHAKAPPNNRSHALGTSPR